MNSNKNYRVFTLVLSGFGIYLIISAIALITDFHWKPLDNINLLSEVFAKTPSTKETKPDKGLTNTTDTPTTTNEPQKKDLSLYQTPDLITNFIPNASQPALPHFTEQLKRLKQTKKGKIRIAFFGDSMIEGDLMTQTLRKLLQQEFGGYGVGFVPINSNVAGFRTTVTTSASGWTDTHFMTKGAKNLYLSGHVFTGAGRGSYTDKTITQTDVIVEKSLIFGKTQGASIDAYGSTINLSGQDAVNRLTLAKDNNHKVTIQSNTASVPIYGVSFESDYGVFVDNFSFRGITGIELGKVEDEIYQAVNKNNPYDLIILQYGVNLMFRPKDTSYTFYGKTMPPVLEKLKKAFPKADFLLIGSADRAFRYNGEYKTAVGLPNLLKLQAEMAMTQGFAFYNNFASMGGENSIVRWANEKPPLANKDYIHPNGRGAEILGEKLYRAIIKDYNKTTQSSK
ncbi:hypothetical protein [Riemerella columbina]|uniref:hypothetical protein n=1 Tax=Riemerella columbina TaxID=103810 RepID=UPI000365B362|nr:hypothetical protein [Riemerella columbina]